MLVLKVALIFVGALLYYFGYAIFFKNKYNLINGFEASKKAHAFDDNYAKKVGLIEFVGGLVYITLGITSLFFGNGFTWIAFVIGIVGLITALLINQVHPFKRTK